MKNERYRGNPVYFLKETLILTSLSTYIILRADWDGFRTSHGRIVRVVFEQQDDYLTANLNDIQCGRPQRWEPIRPWGQAGTHVLPPSTEPR